MSESTDHRPHYGSAFRCIGGACEDNCCAGMGVLIDRATYEKYQNAGGDLGSLVQIHIKRNPVSPTDMAYAQITPIMPSASCPFLANDRLCSIQKEHGPEYLSATCSVYPRALNSVHGELETSLYLSCPEAARFVLLNPEFAEQEGYLHHFRTDQFSNLAGYGEAIYKPHSYFNEVQALVTAMIRDRARPMWQRLLLLGELCHTLDRITQPAEEAIVPEAIRYYRELVATGAMRNELRGIPTNPAAQLSFAIKVTDARCRASNVGARFLDCVQDFLDGIHFADQARLIPSFIHAEKQYFDPFFARHPFMLENYLLNYVYRTLFPFGKESSPRQVQLPIHEEYMLMISQYVSVRTLLIGMAGRYREAFGAEHAVKLIQSFAKAIEHYPTFLNVIVEFVRNCNLMNIQGVAALLASSEGAPQTNELQALIDIGPIIAQGQELRNLIAC
jgi:lysine-N-methylase